MDFPTSLFTHEYLFRQQTARHYPLPSGLIEKYPDMWDFSLLNSNPNMAWDIDTIARFENRIDWLALSRNTGVRWTEALLDRFKTKLVWTDLSANPAFPIEPAILEQFESYVHWVYLSANPALPLDEGFLRRYEDRIHWQILRNYRDDLSEVTEPFRARLETLPKQRYQQKDPKLLRRYLRSEIHPESLPGNLYNRLDERVSQIEPDFLEEFQEYWDWDQLSYGQKVNWSIPMYERFYRLLSEGVTTSAGFYRSVLQPVLDDALIDAVCARLNPEGVVRFYYIEDRRDAYGMLPNVRLPVENAGVMYEKLMRIFQGTDLEAPLPCTRFELSWFLRHPIRFADYHPWPFEEHAPAIVVSSKVKSVIERFRLPPHRFYPIDLEITNDVFGADSRAYFVLFIPEQDYLYYHYEHMVFVEDEDLQPTPVQMLRSYYKTSYFNRQHAPQHRDHIDKPVAYLHARSELKLRDPAKRLRPQEYIWNADFDMISSDSEQRGGSIWLSEDVKKALEAAGVEGIRFERVWESRPRMKGLETPERRAQNEQILEAVRAAYRDRPPEPEQLTVRNFRMAQQWAGEVIRHKGIVRQKYTENPPAATDDPFLLGIREKEVELDVVFPGWFVDILRTEQLPDGLEDFTLLPLERLGCWYLDEAFPLSVKAVTFAEYSTAVLFMLLKRYSYYELDDAIWLHEYDQGPPPWLVVRLDRAGNTIGEINRFGS